ncbi:hypothetical protein HK100_001552 [Physocladia obscura]|uniref:RNA polymerase-associated protein LEO1 n=1 Tax=Physocladia obscura TaxID=109957 RepID=A0AAD5SZ94_9FUNG|nr:hypothetical protein HK100_001552 [Physocladia obscura]
MQSDDELDFNSSSDGGDDVKETENGLQNTDVISYNNNGNDGGYESSESPMAEDLFGEISDEENKDDIDDNQANNVPLEEHEQAASFVLPPLLLQEQYPRNGEYNSHKQENVEGSEHEHEHERNDILRNEQSDNNEDNDNDELRYQYEQQSPHNDNEQEEQVIGSMALPKITAPGRLTTNYLAKMPNFLSVDPNPFDKASFSKSLTEEDLNDEEKRLRLENTIRWRYKDPITKAKDSNARIVRWSDGSFSLLLGSELFDCQLKSMSKDHHYLAAYHTREGVLESQARLTNTVMFVPSSKNSQTHRRMTAAIAQKHQKETGTKLFATVGHDPVAARREAERREREMAKAAKKMKTERQKTSLLYDNRYGTSAERYASSGGNRRYDDYSDDDNTHRRSSGGGGVGRSNLDRYEEDFVEDDDIEEDMSDSEEELRREEKLKASKKNVIHTTSSRNDYEAPAPEPVKRYVPKRRIIDSDDDE